MNINPSLFLTIINLQVNTLVQFVYYPDIFMLTSDQQYIISACAAQGNFTPFHLLVLSPILSNGWALLGEQGKFIAISPQRFQNLRVENNGISVQLRGAPEERVFVYFLDPSGLTHTTLCAFSKSTTVVEALCNSVVCTCT